MEVSFSAKWDEIASSLHHLKKPLLGTAMDLSTVLECRGLRLVENTQAQTYPILVFFKEEIEFDGQVHPGQ